MTAPSLDTMKEYYEAGLVVMDTPDKAVIWSADLQSGTLAFMHAMGSLSTFPDRDQAQDLRAPLELSTADPKVHEAIRNFALVFSMVVLGAAVMEEKR